MPDTSTASKPGTILAVEGDDASRRIIEQALKQQGYEVVVAASVAEGVEIATTSVAPPDAAVVADKPTATDAVAFLTALADASAKKGLDVPVVVTGAPASMARVIETLRAGALDYLRKPLGAKPLVEAVTRVIALGRKRRKEREEKLTRSGIVIPPAAARAAGRGQQPQHPGLAAISDSLKSRTVEVPAVPAVVADLRKAIRGQKSSLDDVARLIQRDQSLSLDVLKIANSAVYARGSRTSDLKIAVGRIGLVQLEGLIEMVFLRDCYQPRVPLFKSLLSEIWRYSVGMALAMRILADGMTGTSRLDGGVAYAAGLLSDVGASYLLWLFSERAPDLEIDVFLPFVRDRHEAIGGQVLAAMSLDAAVVQLGSHHHAQSPPMGVSLYWSLGAVATELVDRAVPRGDLTRGTRRGASFVGQAADTLRLNEAAMRKAGDQLQDELHGILEALG